jgi:hypothetical protein
VRVDEGRYPNVGINQYDGGHGVAPELRQQRR